MPADRGGYNLDVGLLESRVSVCKRPLRRESSVSCLPISVESFTSWLLVSSLDGLTSRVAYARSLTEGQTVLDGYDDTAAREVRVLLEDIGTIFS